jgi:hypothetical protein
MTNAADALSRARVRIDLLLQRYSVWPLVGLGVGVVSTLVASALLQATQVQIDANRQALAATLMRATTAPPAQAAASPPAWGVLPDVSAQPADLKALFQLARKRGLLLAQADYAAAAHPGAPVEALQLDLPLAGRYPQLRAFAEDALRALPHLSIDRIGFERQGLTTGDVTARMKMTLWYRGRLS